MISSHSVDPRLIGRVDDLAKGCFRLRIDGYGEDNVELAGHHLFEIGDCWHGWNLACFNLNIESGR